MERSRRRRYTYEDFEKLDKLGEGTYGMVTKCKEKLTGEVYAIKDIKYRKEMKKDEEGKISERLEGIPPTSLREIACLKTLDHPNVIGQKGVIMSGFKKFSIIFEYIDGDLKDRVDKLRPGQFFPEETIKVWMYQILLGTAYCHSRMVIHRDLKPNNILITEDDTIKIADFGLARTFNLPVTCYTKEVITLWYRAPELLLGEDEYSTCVDIWSIGCIMYELSHLSTLFPGDSEIGTLMKIFSILGTPTEQVSPVNGFYWPEVESLKWYKKTFPKFKGKDPAKFFPKLSEEGIDLLMKLLTPCPYLRIEAHEALKHPWFDDLDKTKYADPSDLYVGDLLNLP